MLLELVAASFCCLISSLLHFLSYGNKCVFSELLASLMIIVAQRDACPFHYKYEYYYAHGKEQQ